jgi:TolA-binding protein
MDDFFAKVVLAFALASAAAPPAPALADAGDDQYAVAAGHYARDRWKLAIEEFSSFRRDFPRHPKFEQAIFFQAEAHMQQEDFAEARTLFREFIERAGKSRYRRQALFRIGEASYLGNDRQPARDELEQFLAEYADDALNAYVLCYLGEIELAERHWGEAETLFARCLKEFPRGQMQDDCRFGLARALQEQKKRDEARRLYLALSGKTASPLADDALFRLAALEYDNGDYQESLATLTEFEQKFAQSNLLDRARLSRGWTLYRLDRFKDAKVVFESLVQQPDVSIEARYWLGLTLRAQHDWPASAKTLDTLAGEIDKVESSGELAPEIMFHAGDALRRADELEPAARRFREVLDRYSKSDWVDDALVGLMQIAWHNRDHDDIARLASQFEREFVASPLADEVDRLSAQSLVDRKRFDEAAALLEPLVERDKRAADRYLLALAYRGLGRDEQALKLINPLATEEDSELTADALQVQAALWIAQERYAEAIAPLNRLLKLRGASEAADPCRAQLVVCYARTRNVAKARQAWDELTDHEAAASLVQAATQHLAEAYYAGANYSEAAEMFDRLTDDKLPEDAVAKGLSGVAWSRYRLDQLQPAAAAFERLVKSHAEHPLAPEAALVRGQICEKLDKPQDALEMYRLVIDNYRDSNQRSQAMLAAARILDRRNDDRDAEKHYAQLLEEYPRETFLDAALYERAWVLRELKDQQGSLAQFRRLHEDYPDSRFWADASFRLAEQAYADKQYDAAKLMLDSLVERRPDQAKQPHVLFLEGQVAAATARWSDAARAMQQLIDVQPEHALRPLAEYWVAEAEYRRGHLDEASQRLTALAERTESRHEAWMAMVPLRRAQILAEQKKWSEAQRLAAGIAGRFPEFDQLYEADYVIGRALASRGEFESARAAYQKVIRSSSGSKTETAAMAQWMIGETFFHQKKYEAALREYLRVEILYDYPQWQAAALLQAGKCQEHLGQADEAAELYQRLINDFSATTFVKEAERRLEAVREKRRG